MSNVVTWPRTCGGVSLGLRSWSVITRLARRPVCAFAAAFACLIVQSPHALGQMPATVVLDAATMQHVDQMRRVTGQVRAFQRSTVSSQEEGWVVRLAKRAGEAVEKGDVLAELDPERLQLSLEQLRADFDAAEASRAERRIEAERARRELDRVVGLSEQGIAGEQEVDNAEAALASGEASLRRAESQVLAARAGVRFAERRLRDATIRAPFDGRVISTMTEVGEWVEFGGAVAEVLATDRVEVWADVPQQTVRFVEQPGRRVEILVPAADFVGESTEHAVIPAGDELSRIFPLRIVIDAQDTLLRPGMSADVFVPTGDLEQTLTVHKDAVLRDDAGLFVYMAVPYAAPPGSPPEMSDAFELMAVPARIERLFGLPGRVAIRPGSLPPGARLVTEGNERMYPTQPLVVVEANQPPPMDQPPSTPGKAAGRAPGADEHSGQTPPSATAGG